VNSTIEGYDKLKPRRGRKETTNGCRILAGKPHEKRLPGRLRRMREDNNMMDLRKICCEDGK
jgi:hypothetical protein